MPGTESYIVEDSLGKPYPPSSTARTGRGGVAALAGSVKRLGAGIGVLVDWVGSGGKPVSVAIAVSRAAVCKDCPKNKKSAWTEWATAPIAAKIKDQLGMCETMRLSTPYDADLHTCSACLCWLPLKVWTPLEHITDHMSNEVKADLHPSCWILHEAHEIEV